eukprot:6102905-Amphidinium_carterae.1
MQCRQEPPRGACPRYVPGSAPRLRLGVQRLCRSTRWLGLRREGVPMGQPIFRLVHCNGRCFHTVSWCSIKNGLGGLKRGDKQTLGVAVRHVNAWAINMAIAFVSNVCVFDM